MYYLDPAAGVALSASYAVLFAAAGVHKLWALEAFAQSLAAYEVLPQRAVRPASVLVPLLELGVAAGLLIPSLRPFACLAAAGLLLVYGGAMALNLRRGRRELDCGCMGFGRGHTISAALVWRNVALAVGAALLAAVPFAPRIFNWVDALTILGATSVAALLYAAVDGLIESSRRLPRRSPGIQT